MRNAQTFEADEQSLVLNYSENELSAEERQYLGVSLSDAQMTQDIKDYLNNMGKFDLMDNFILKFSSLHPIHQKLNLGTVNELFSELEEEFGATT